MNDFKLIMCDEPLYIHRLSDYFCTKLDIEDISICSERRCLLEEITSSLIERKTILLLVNESLVKDIDEEIPDTAELFVLGEKIMGPDLEKGDESKSTLYKYQSARQLIIELYEKSVLLKRRSDIDSNKIRLLKRDGKELNPIRHNRSDKMLYGVYSPEGKCCKTSFAIALGELLSESGKTLYMNLEGYSGMFLRERKNTYYGVANVIYDYMSDKDRCLTKLSKNVINRNGLEYIYPSGLMELQEISEDIWLGFIEFIIENTDYKYIVIDLGDCIRGIGNIMKECNSVFVPIVSDSPGSISSKIEEFACQCDEHDLLIHPNGNIREIKLPNVSDIDLTGYGLRSRQLMNYIRREGLLLN